jgi:hypothetical protein
MSAVVTAATSVATRPRRPAEQTNPLQVASRELIVVKSR